MGCALTLFIMAATLLAVALTVAVVCLARRLLEAIARRVEHERMMRPQNVYFREVRTW